MIHDPSLYTIWYFFAFQKKFKRVFKTRGVVALVSHYEHSPFREVDLRSEVHHGSSLGHLGKSINKYFNCNVVAVELGKQPEEFFHMQRRELINDMQGLPGGPAKIPETTASNIQQCLKDIFCCCCS